MFQRNTKNNYDIFSILNLDKDTERKFLDI